jgi:epoxyqueuosine reductase
VLTEALRRESALVRTHAAWALGEIGGLEAKQALQSARLSEAESQVRDEIESALSNI